MTPKERAAMQQALAALEGDWNAMKKARAALREALDHSGEANEMVGCAYCNNPLFAGTKCNNCGRITLAEQADVKESFTTQFIPVGIVNDQHCITWMEEIVDDQAPIGAILYAKEQL